MAQEQETDQILLVFDFDHTVIDDNADLSVCKLAPGGILPDNITALYNDRGWIPYMDAVFQHLHQNGVSPEKIQQHVETLPLTPGMQELFTYLQNANGYDTIIISDGNSVLIKYLLAYRQLDSLVSKVFTNPAEFSDSGCLQVSNYHSQNWCSLSTVNLCKGHVLQDYVKQRSLEGISYSHVLYIGDGLKDLCPGLTLRPEDYLLPRKGFSLWKKLKERKTNVNNLCSSLKASVVEWESGVEIKALLENIVSYKASQIPNK